MATLAADDPRDYQITGHEAFNDFPIIAADIIYRGAAVGDNASGLARPLVAADPFLGFAMSQCDNSAGAASAKNVHVRVRGRIKIPVVGVTAQSDLGATVYASDDDTFTLSSTGNSTIGKIVQRVSGTTCIVEFEGAGQRSI